MAEAQHEHSVAGGGTSLSVAVRLVQSYLFLARCAEAPASRTCGRAHQLAQLLDSTGPLLLRRRIDEASKYVPMEHLALSPQCGFASVAAGNLLSMDDQWRKLDLVVDVARKVWG